MMRDMIDSIRRYPKYCVWELTLRCNMKCKHCGSFAGGRRGNELNTDEALKLCDDLAELGCERVTLLGGEPFIREDWEQIASRLLANGVRCNAISNGWLFTDVALIDRIKEVGLSNIAISVDGVREDHDDLRNREGSFDRVITALKLLRRRGVPSAAVTVITKAVLDKLEQLYSILVDEGVLLWQIQTGVPNGRLSENRSWLLEPEQVLKVVEFAHRVRSEKRIRLDISDNVGYYGPLEPQVRPTSKKQIPYWTGCYAGCQTIGIDANGDIKGCLALQSIPRFIEGNIRETPLKEIWTREGAFAYTRQFQQTDLGSFCASCEFSEICRGGCTAARWGFTGDLRETPYCVHRILTEQGKTGDYGYTAETLKNDLKLRGFLKSRPRDD